MATATNQQVQVFSDTRVRVRCESIRSLVGAVNDDKAEIDDVYAACAQQSPTWTDNRADGPPHLLGPQDILAYNAFISDLQTFINGNANYAIVEKACVRPAVL
jgi:hypothetical protein